MIIHNFVMARFSTLWLHFAVQLNQYNSNQSMSSLLPSLLFVLVGGRRSATCVGKWEGNHH